MGLLRLVIAPVAAIAFLTAAITGTIAIQDTTGEISAVVIKRAQSADALLQLPNAVFIGLPSADGQIWFECANGMVVPGPYVTPGMRIWERTELNICDG